MNKIINFQNDVFSIETKNTVYGFKVLNNKYLAHLFYGNKQRAVYNYEPMPRGHVSYAEESNEKVYFETMLNEYSFFGAGDFGEDCLRIRNKNGNCVTDFVFADYKIIDGTVEVPDLPNPYRKGEVKTLVVTLKDTVTKCLVRLIYTSYYDFDVIARHIVLENNGETVLLENAKSLCLDLRAEDYDFINLTGCHYFERTIQRNEIPTGRFVSYSERGISSHHFNPFLAVCDKSADYQSGEVYGFNLIYSGNFENVIEKNPYGRTRVVCGMNGKTDSQTLNCGEKYYSPVAIMTYSDAGIGRMSRNFHAFTNNCIVPEKFKDEHPIVLNTWEAFYFDINESKLLALADEAVKLGIDTLVIDDGWFSSRNADNAGLGDWWVNKEKFPSGLQSFSEKIAAKGINLGIWIEPEMVNPDSELYRTHPEWSLNAYGRELSKSRNQLVLNLALPEVMDYLKKSLGETFDGVKFNYVKWDMNRCLSKVGCNFDGGENCDNGVQRAFIKNMYALHDWLINRYPDIIIEGCCGGGGRYDLGMLRYCSQIWASDNTFPADRARIQFGTLTAYPSSSMSCHVSNPNGALKNAEENDYRFKIASQGVLGYEMDLLSVDDEIKSTIKSQIEEYKKIKEIILKGEYYPVYAKQETYIFYYKYADKILIEYATQTRVNDKQIIRLQDITDDYIDENGVKYSQAELLNGFELKFTKKADYILLNKI